MSTRGLLYEEVYNATGGSISIHMIELLFNTEHLNAAHKRSAIYASYRRYIWT